MSGNRRKKRLQKTLRPARRDRLMRLVVDLGRAYRSSLGKAFASALLRAQHVPEHVITRVLRLTGSKMRRIRP